MSTTELFDANIMSSHFFCQDESSDSESVLEDIITPSTTRTDTLSDESERTKWAATTMTAEIAGAVRLATFVSGSRHQENPMASSSSSSSFTDTCTQATPKEHFTAPAEFWWHRLFSYTFTIPQLTCSVEDAVDSQRSHGLRFGEPRRRRHDHARWLNGLG